MRYKKYVLEVYPMTTLTGVSFGEVTYYVVTHADITLPHFTNWFKNYRRAPINSLYHRSRAMAWKAAYDAIESEVISKLEN